MKIYQLAALAALTLATVTGSALSASAAQTATDHDRCVNAINSNNASDVRAFCPKSEWLVDQ